MQMIYRISMGGETKDFESYDLLIHWLWIHSDEWEIQSMETVYTMDVPSKKVLIYHLN